MDSYYTALIAAGSAIIAGSISIISVNITSKANLKSSKIEFDRAKLEKAANLKREKGEQLYELVDSWLLEFANHYLMLSPVMQNKYSYNTYLDMFIDNAKNERTKYVKIEMIIDIYYPELSKSYGIITDFRDKINVVQHGFSRAYKSGVTSDKDAFDKYTDYSFALQKFGDSFKKDISTCVRDI